MKVNSILFILASLLFPQFIISQSSLPLPQRNLYENLLLLNAEWRTKPAVTVNNLLPSTYEELIQIHLNEVIKTLRQKECSMANEQVETVLWVARMLNSVSCLIGPRYSSTLQ